MLYQVTVVFDTVCREERERDGNEIDKWVIVRKTVDVKYGVSLLQQATRVCPNAVSRPMYCS